MEGLYLMYNNTPYEKDLFDIFKHVTLFEKYYMDCYLKKDKKDKIDNERKHNFISELNNKLFNFKSKYENMVLFDSISIKNKIMIVSIVRKIYSFFKGSDINEFLDVNNIQLYHIKM